jgi:hypothetical protein
MRVLRVAAAALVLALVAAPAHATPAPTARAAAPVPLVPDLPAPLDPVAEAVSPLVWQTCRAVGLVIGLTEVAGTLAGLPPSTTTSVNDVIAAATGPVLTTFFEVCQQIPLPDDPPTCAVDAQLPSLPYLGRPVLVAGLLANELRALDTAFGKLGVPLHGALGDAADAVLACAAGRDPSPAAPAPAPASPSAAPATALPGLGTSVAVAAPSYDGPSLDVGPSTDDRPVATAPPVRAAGPVRPETRPVRASGADQGRGTAWALVGLAALAAAAWRVAGRPRRAAT